MPTLIPYHLTFRGGFHLGSRGVNLGEALVSIPSDTLFSAFVHAWRRMGQDPAALLSPFMPPNFQPPFRITSAFPFVGGVRFYPVPTDLRGLFSKAVIQDRGKALKRIRFLSAGILQLAQAGQSLDLWLFPKDEKDTQSQGVGLQGGSLWLLPDEVQQLPNQFHLPPKKLHALLTQNVWFSSQVQRVRLDRLSSASTIYQAGKVSFAPGCGLWFGAAWASSTNQPNPQMFEQALAILQDDGLGGERTSGYGQFTYTPHDPITLPAPHPGEIGLLLSRYHPCAGELPQALTAPGTAYQLVSVGGWIHSPDVASLRRQRIQLVTEGSLIHWPNGSAGDLADVTPNLTGELTAAENEVEIQNPPAQSIKLLPHSVYRYGLALAAAWPLKTEVTHA